MHLGEILQDQLVHLDEALLERSGVLLLGKVGVGSEHADEVALAKFGGFNASVPIKNGKATHAIAVNIFVADVCIFHTKSPALHTGHGKLVAHSRLTHHVMFLSTRPIQINEVRTHIIYEKCSM